MSLEKRMRRVLLNVAEEGPDSSVDGEPCWCIKATRDALRSAFTKPADRTHDWYCLEARALVRELDQQHERGHAAQREGAP